MMPLFSSSIHDLNLFVLSSKRGQPFHVKLLKNCSHFQPSAASISSLALESPPSQGPQGLPGPSRAFQGPGSFGPSDARAVEQDAKRALELSRLTQQAPSLQQQIHGDFMMVLVAGE